MVMKYLSDEELAQQQGIDPVTGKALSSAPGDTMTAGSPPVQNVSQGTGGGGTGFTSITQYLEQNRPQAAKLASQVGQFVTDKGEAARTSLNEAEGKFNEASKPIALDQDLLNRAVTDPSQFIQSQEDVDKFNTMKSAEYGGPATFEEGDYFTGLSKALEDARTAGEETKSATGQKNLLTEMAKTPNVTPGMTSLNQLLLANPEARTELSTAREGLSDLDQRLSSASEAAKSRAETAKTTTSETAGAVSEALKKTYADFQSQVDAKVAADKAKAAAEIEAYKNALAGYQTTGINPDYLGISKAALQDIMLKNTSLPTEYRTDLTQYFSALNPEAVITRGNAASPEDYAKWSALNALSGNPDVYGGQYGFLPDEYSGAYNPDMVDFNVEALKEAMNAQYKKMQEAYVLGNLSGEWTVPENNPNTPNNFMMRTPSGWEGVNPYDSNSW